MVVPNIPISVGDFAMSTAWFNGDSSNCMYCGIKTKGVSLVACTLLPHGDNLAEGCLSFTCLQCCKYLDANASICPKVKVVCLNNMGCGRAATFNRPKMICKCGLKICDNCYSVEEFKDSDGLCQVCIWHEQADMKRAREEDDTSERAAKRVKTEDSNGEARG